MAQKDFISRGLHTFVHEPAEPVAAERLAQAVGQAARTYSRSAASMSRAHRVFRPRRLRIRATTVVFAREALMSHGRIRTPVRTPIPAGPSPRAIECRRISVSKAMISRHACTFDRGNRCRKDNGNRVSAKVVARAGSSRSNSSSITARVLRSRGESRMSFLHSLIHPLLALRRRGAGTQQAIRGGIHAAPSPAAMRVWNGLHFNRSRRAGMVERSGTGSATVMTTPLARDGAQAAPGRTWACARRTEAANVRASGRPRILRYG
jgi:hypothetical protein